MVALCAKQVARQAALTFEAKTKIADAMLLQTERCGRTFDLLCAMVIYGNWGHFFCAKANLTPLVSLAAGLADDLGLTKPVPQVLPTVMLNWTARGCPKPPYALVLKKRTMEERRVVLGLFLVSSV